MKKTDKEVLELCKVWFEDIMERSDRLTSGNVSLGRRAIYGVAKYVDEHLASKKSDWSEEDEKNINFLCEILTDLQVKSTENEIKHGTNSCSEHYYNIKKWLKSLKDRVFPQPKQEWSEEDEKMIQDIINDIAIAEEQVYCKSRCEDEINWLKSLRPQNRWKPSDEQLKQLGKYCPDNRPLTSLYEQLNKLREE